MPRVPVLGALLLIAASARGADVFKPPVLTGVKGDGKQRQLRAVEFPEIDGSVDRFENSGHI